MNKLQSFAKEAKNNAATAKVKAEWKEKKKKKKRYTSRKVQGRGIKKPHGRIEIF